MSFIHETSEFEQLIHFCFWYAANGEREKIYLTFFNKTRTSVTDQLVTKRIEHLIKIKRLDSSYILLKYERQFIHYVNNILASPAAR